MNKLSLLSADEIQSALCEYLINQRKAKRLSRQQLSELSTVPVSTIKKFETTQQISLRQFTLLWQSLDKLESLNALTKKQLSSPVPTSIEEVLRS